MILELVGAAFVIVLAVCVSILALVGTMWVISVVAREMGNDEDGS